MVNRPPVQIAADGDANYRRAGEGAVGAPAQRGHLVAKLHHGGPDVIEKLDLGYRLEAAHGHADGPAHDGGFGKRGVERAGVSASAMDSVGCIRNDGVGSALPGFREANRYHRMRSERRHVQHIMTGSSVPTGYACVAPEDPMTDVGEIVKSGAADKLADLIHKLAGPMAEEVGLMLVDSIKAYRLKNWLRVAEKTKKILANSKVKPNAVPPRLLLPNH